MDDVLTCAGRELTLQIAEKPKRNSARTDFAIIFPHLIRPNHQLLSRTKLSELPSLSADY